MTQIVRTYLRDGERVTITGDASLHRRYANYPVWQESAEAVAEVELRSKKLVGHSNEGAYKAAVNSKSLLDEVKEEEERRKAEAEVGASSSKQSSKSASIASTDEVEIDVEEGSRPSGNAATDEWYEYRVASGYDFAELEGLSRNQLRDLEDR